jgi:hypothetical protein
MIKPEDAEYHFKPDSHWQWVETIALPFHVPEASLNGIIYVVTRPMLGVCACDISLHDRLTDLWEEQLYIDNQQHLPCPKSLLNFTLPNGLTIEATDPSRRYRARYEGIDETHFDLEFVALHDPFDLNDPEMDPMAAKRQSGAWDSSWSGHYDVTYRVTGELVARGKRYKIDCVDTGDRSWGPRPERDNSSVIWWHASFGEALTVHLFKGARSGEDQRDGRAHQRLRFGARQGVRHRVVSRHPGIPQGRADGGRDRGHRYAWQDLPDDVLGDHFLLLGAVSVEHLFAVVLPRQSQRPDRLRRAAARPEPRVPDAQPRRDPRA